MLNYILVVYLALNGHVLLIVDDIHREDCVDMQEKVNTEYKELGIEAECLLRWSSDMELF